MSFTAEQKAAFDRDGFIIVSGLFEPEQIKAAQQEIERITYGKSFASHLADHEAGFAKSADSTPRRTQFPTGIKVLDSMIENNDYLDCFAGCLGTEEMSYCNAHLFVRSGPDDTRHAPEPWQGYHADDDTCSFLPPHPDVQQYAYINSWVFLSDIEEDSAPLHVIPGSHRQLAELLPRLTKNCDAINGGFRDIREVPEFAEPIPVLGKAGDTLLYSSYLVHGAVSFTNKKKQRAVSTFTLGRKDNDAWTKYSHLYLPVEREYSLPFWTKTSPRVRSLFGWPPPGHPYYTPDTLELIAARFPEMDLEPYRNA